MKVILKESIENIGKRGDIVTVAAGYGRNYLIPKKLAIEVTPSNIKMIEIEQHALQKKLEKEVSSYRDLIERINQTTLSFTRKTGEKDTLFGSVSPQDIKDSLDILGIVVERKKILIGEPIKKLGNYTVSIKIFQEEQAEVKVEVIGEDGSRGEEVEKALKAESEKRETERAEEEVKPQEEKVEPEEEEVGSKEVKTEPDEVKAEPDEVKAEPDEVKAEPDEMKAEPEDVKAEPEEAKTEPGEMKEEDEELKAVSEEAEAKEAEEKPEEVESEKEKAASEEKKEEQKAVIEEKEEEKIPAVQEKEKKTKIKADKKKE